MSAQSTRPDVAAPRVPPAHDEDLAAPELTVVIPCLNEARTLGICIRKAQDSFERLGIAGEVVVADNGSVDGSQEIAQDPGAPRVPVAGKGQGNARLGGYA